MYQYCNCKYVLNRVVLCVMISKKIFHEKIAEKKCYGSHGLVVMGEAHVPKVVGSKKRPGMAHLKNVLRKGPPRIKLKTLIRLFLK